MSNQNTAGGDRGRGGNLPPTNVSHTYGGIAQGRVWHGVVTDSAVLHGPNTSIESGTWSSLSPRVRQTAAGARSGEARGERRASGGQAREVLEREIREQDRAQTQELSLRDAKIWELEWTIARLTETIRFPSIQIQSNPATRRNPPGISQPPQPFQLQPAPAPPPRCQLGSPFEGTTRTGLPFRPHQQSPSKTPVSPYPTPAPQYNPHGTVPLPSLQHQHQQSSSRRRFAVARNILSSTPEDGEGYRSASTSHSDSMARGVLLSPPNHWPRQESASDEKAPATNPVRESASD